MLTTYHLIFRATNAPYATRTHNQPATSEAQARELAMRQLPAPAWDLEECAPCQGSSLPNPTPRQGIQP
jgi:hypothetical protein